VRETWHYALLEVGLELFSARCSGEKTELNIWGVLLNLELPDDVLNNE
jgi:hypothetical protein